MSADLYFDQGCGRCPLMGTPSCKVVVSFFKGTLLNFIEEATALEISGAKIEFQDQSKTPYPTFLTDYFTSHPELAEAFARLTPGRQRSYLLYFQSAKQAATQLRRIKQCSSKILIGKGWQEY